MGLRCIIPHRYLNQLNQLKTLATPLSKPKSGKNFAVLRYFDGQLMGTPSPNQNIKVGLYHPDVGLRCIIPPRHLSPLKTLAIPLSKPKSGKNFAVLQYLYGLLMGTPSPNQNIKVRL